MEENMIATAKHVCGRYCFTSWLPRIGSASDAPVWTASVDGETLLGRFPTLEDAMRVAINSPRSDPNGR